LAGENKSTRAKTHPSVVLFTRNAMRSILGSVKALCSLKLENNCVSYAMVLNNLPYAKD
jgi:hypothetical protein